MLAGRALEKWLKKQNYRFVFTLREYQRKFSNIKYEDSHCLLHAYYEVGKIKGYAEALYDAGLLDKMERDNLYRFYIRKIV